MYYVENFILLQVKNNNIDNFVTEHRQTSLISKKILQQ